MTTSDLILDVVLAVIAIGVIVSLWRFHKDDRFNSFNLIYLVMNKEGLPHRPAMMELGVFVLLCWGFIVQMVRGGVPEWYVGAMLAFVLRGAHAAYLKSKENGNGETK